MGRLLEYGPGTARIEADGQARPMQGRIDARAGERVAFHETNSPALVERLLGALDVGAIPVLAHPRWPAARADDALQRAGAGQPWGGDEVATLLFTSGSTAAPKVVAHTLDAHLRAAEASAARVPFGPQHRWLLSLPLCHVGGLSLLFRTVVGGATLVLPTPDESLPQSLVRLRPSHLSLVATQLRDLLDDAQAAEALAACEAVLLGGGPSPPELVRRALDRGVALRRTYGMTEMGSQIATEVDGKVLPLDGVELRTDAHQQLWVRGPQLFAGYLEREQLQRPFEHGWFATGDLARIDDSGLAIVGRRDNQFVSGGENVQPEAIEATLAERGVEAIVVPVPDARYGARPVAFTLDGAAHDALAEQLLPSFARPIAWLPLPDSAGLKPQRTDLRRAAARWRGEPDQ